MHDRRTERCEAEKVERDDYQILAHPGYAPMSMYALTLLANMYIYK
jgi:hypothetical protein